jgi:MHS family proline/betaine transporter-like MFS transporter
VFGNFMEYIDFGSYGFMAAIIGKVFFSGSSTGTQLLASLAVFGVSFLFRPFGGAIFGYVGDRFGRKTALVWTVIMMAFSTGVVGLLPSSARAGLLAPVLLVICRAVQGLSIGGEYSGGSSFVVESAPLNKRGVWASTMSWTAAAGTIVGSALVLILTASTSTAAMDSWGWRIPFLIAFPLGLVGLYMQLKLQETQVFKDLQNRSGEQVKNNPYRRLGLSGVKKLGLCVAFGGGTGLGYYFFATYFNTYLSSTIGMARTPALIISLVSLAIYGGCTPLVGMLSDRFGRKKMFVIGFFAFVIYGIPAFLLVGTGFAGAFVGIVIFGMIESILNVLTVVVMPEIFPADTRVTGGAIGYNIGIALISGTGPFVAAALVSATGYKLVPGFYLVALMLVIGIIVLLWLPETAGRNLYLSTKQANDADVAIASAPEALQAAAGVEKVLVGGEQRAD